MTCTQPPDSVLRLCETFALHREHYRSGQYNETQLRREFLDPFFKALGWDIDNERGYADAYKDVIHEDAIRMGVSTKAPDYCFRIGGARKFFLEAKKPSVNIESDSAPAYQLRRYGWSAKLPLSILSDFEEFAVYDTRLRPQKNDRPSVGRTLYITCDQYAERWGEIAAIFSREAVLRGSFDTYADTSKQKRGTGTVDDAFLEEIERWRDALARHLALRNPELSVRDLNYAVQKTIDRIIFLRICEDRGTEDYGRLQALLNGTRTYPRLMELFRQADDRYNSGLFHYESERGRSGEPDTLTPDLCVDDKVLKDILANLYYPDSPYAFSVLPADILGQVYEQFLGKTIRLTAGHQAKIEEKPEVRKAGGVYYTPGYIVDYIVRNTLGRLLDGDDPAKPAPVTLAKAAEIKVLDPACGSGSFLIVAYQHLLDWHLRQYTADPATGTLDVAKAQKHAAGKVPRVYQASGAVWRLTTAERKRILLNGIHGVDIDAQAVEVTKLSLLLKVLEGETQQQLQRDFLSERQRILPDLDNNIKCGNSLIGPDFYEHEQMLLLDDDTQYRLNVFDWSQGFPAIMKRGGFDCVIGNPPYGIPFSTEEVTYIAKHYSPVGRLFDSYSIFMVAAHRLTVAEGVFSYIVPNTFCDLESGVSFRQWLLSSVTLEKLCQTGWVFSQAVVDTLVFVARAKEPAAIANITIELPDDTFQVSIDTFRKAYLYKIDFRNRPEARDLLEKVAKYSRPLAEFLVVKAGVKLYERGKGIPPQTQDIIQNRVFTRKGTCPNDWMPLLRGGNISRYAILTTDEFVHYGEWLAAPRKAEMFSRPKLLMRRTDDRILTAFDDTGMIGVNSCHIMQFCSKDMGYAYCYFLGLLNSRLIQHVFEISNPQMVGKVFSEIKVIYVERLPIRPIDFENLVDVALHDKMVQLVDRMLDLNRKKATEKNPDVLRQIETQISLADRQIDALVYQLYSLTPEEIAIVEG